MSKLAKKLETSIGNAAVEDLARQTKFVQRSSELNGFNFALLNMKSIDSDGFSSLTEQCVQLKKDYEVTISKQGLDDKYSEKSTSFLQTLFLKVLKIQLNNAIDLSTFNCFSGIYVRDALMLKKVAA